jgi:hypothetical protein
MDGAHHEPLPWPELRFLYLPLVLADPEPRAEHGLARHYAEQHDQPGNWRTLFFIEGAFPFLIAAPLWWWLVADRPSQASWVSRDEREYIETSLARENAEAPRFAGYRSVFRSSVVWRLVLV